MPDVAKAAPTPFSPERLFRTMMKHGHTRALGFRFSAIGDDWAEVILPWRADLVGDEETQTLASGAIIALMDMTAGVAVWTKINAFRPQATLDLRIDYLRAARPHSPMIGRVECYRVARDVAFVRGHAHDGDPADEVLHVAGTFMFTGPVMFK